MTVSETPRTSPSAELPPPGWYRDPLGAPGAGGERVRRAGRYVDPAHLHDQRWWDGESWSPRVLDHAEVGEDPIEGWTPPPPKARKVPTAPKPPKAPVPVETTQASPSAKSAPAGWYPDPLRFWPSYHDPSHGHEWRWWDSVSWSAWVADGGVFGNDPIDGPSPSPPAPARPLGSAKSPPPGPGSSKGSVLAALSIALSIVTMVFFIDLFAPLTAPVAIVMGVMARRRAETDEVRSRARLAIWLGVGSLALFVLMIPVFNAMNEGM